MKSRLTKSEIEAAARVFRDHGMDISLPWEGDLDDVERARFDALCEALVAAYLETARASIIAAENVRAAQK